MASAQSTTRIKRKPPPSFPYSPRWPQPDPSDPFAPLSVLRSRAHSSTTALDDPPNDPTPSLRPSTTESRKTHILYPDQTPEQTYTPSRLTDADPQRPWYGLAKGYLADATKPLRPPKSKKRFSQGGDFLPSLSDADVLTDATRQRLTMYHQRDIEATPRDTRASIARRESYHYRRRSQSVNALQPARREGKEPVRASTTDDAQYAYDTRQSHGFVFGDVDRLEPPVPRTHTHSSASTRSETSTSGVSRHGTPPMTPDDTLSSISMTSPRRSRSRSISPQLLLEDLPAAKPLPVPSDDDEPLSHSNRNTIIASTPVRPLHALDFSILLPPPLPPIQPPSLSPSLPPPSPAADEPLAPLAASVARMPGRRVESDSEVTLIGSLRRRSRTTSLDEMKKRLRTRPPPPKTTSVRGKVISHPAPVPPSVPPLPVLTKPSCVALELDDALPASKLPKPQEPKPRKSLSHVNLGLKPLPNMSLAPTVAPSTNTSVASVASGPLPLLLPATTGNGKRELPRAQSAPLPPPAEKRPSTQRAKTESVAQFSSDEEDAAAYSILAHFRRLVPEPTTTTTTTTTRASSPIPIPVPKKRLCDGMEGEVPACYRQPEPMPLSPPVRATSPLVKEPAVFQESPRTTREDERSRSEDTGYLPVAQLRPAVSRQGTSGSVRPAYKRGASGSSTRVQVGREGSDTTPERKPARVKSPESAARKTGNHLKVESITKDRDSPLPPPPLAFLAARHASPEPSEAGPEEEVVQEEAYAEISFSEPLGQSTPALALRSPWVAPWPEPEPAHGRACSPVGSGAYACAPDFDVGRLPSREQVARAAGLVVVSQTGVRVPFGELFRERKTVVVFIRHFWCPLCQDYMYEVSRDVDPEVLERANVGLVVIGNGSPAMIKSYRQIFRTPFALYTDPTHRVYSTLGMTLRTTDGGHEHERGAYVRHGTIGGIAMVVRNLLRVGMPVWEKGGDIAQLGGEFVLGPGLTCSYAHRMKNTRAHAPILDVLAAAGVHTHAPRPSTSPRASSDTCRAHKHTPSTSSSRRCARCDEPESPYVRRGSAKRSTTSHSHESHRRRVRDVATSDADTESEERDRAIRLKAARAKRQQGPRQYRVANPDRARPPPPPRSESMEKYVLPVVKKEKREKKGRREEEAYMLTHEVLAYSFGNNL